MNSLFKGIKHLLLALIVAFSTQAATAQITVTGTVTDGGTGDPMIGATVLVEGTASGAVTDVDGRYSLTIQDPNATLVYSYVGYLDEKVVVDGRTEIDVTLMPSIEMLSEMVVVGYGTVKKEDLTGSVAVVTAEDLNRLPSANVTQALQGRAPGVVVNQTGSPGQNAQILIRGIGSINQGSGPTYVIDGVITDNLNAVNPQDIESVQVLKDASAAAIYGADGANGVVIITTKRGESGKPQVSYESFVSMGITPPQFELLNADQYADFYNEIYFNRYLEDNEGDPTGYELPFSYSDEFRQFYYGNGWETGTDWQDEITRSAWSHNHNLRISGGGESSNYSISTSYLNESGLLHSSSAERIGIRANSDFDIGEYVTIGESFSLIRRESQRPEMFGWGNSLIASPLMKVNDEDRKGGFDGPQNNIFWGIDPDTNDSIFYPNTGGNDKHNPRAHLSYGDFKDFNTNILANIYMEVKPFSWLTLRTMPSVDGGFGRRKYWLPSYDAGVRSVNQATLEERFSEFLMLSIENQITFAETFGDHNITATAVHHVRKSESNSVDVEAAGFPYENLNTIGASAELGRQVQGGYGPFASESYLGRLNYDFAGKYLITASIRRDGNSRFGEENRWGTFPAASVAWRMSDDLFTNVEGLSMLKLRLGWGMTGNSEIGGFQFQSNLSSFNNFSPVLGESQGLVPALNVLHDFGNPVIKWEAAEMINVGVDASFMEGKIDLSADYYIKNQNDLLVRIPISQAFGRVVGAASPYANIGQLQNRGFEFLATYRKMEGAFNYEVNANITTVKNEVISLPADIIRDNHLTTEGSTIGSFYGYIAEGVIQQDDFDPETGEYLFAEPATGVPAPGDLRFKDLNNDGQINDDDRTIIGKAFPDFTYSLNVSLMYAGFDLTMFLYGSQNFSVYNQQRAAIEGFSSQDLDHNKLTDFAMNYYGRPDIDANGNYVYTDDNGNILNPSTEYFRADPDNTNLNDRFSTWFLEDASFLRIKDLQLGFTLKDETASRLGLNRARIYVSAVNLLTITGYTGRDPEAPTRFSGNPLTPGVDGGAYPLPRIFSAGVQINI